jgi:hypothetical protein
VAGRGALLDAGLAADFLSTSFLINIAAATREDAMAAFAKSWRG